ncbi:FAD-dependent oxidoreductase [Herbiconiux liukaitaii]|uniref:FAD-dependent oxidoreductase n=1 Tax=Herbiconiux liukaitaii TaxID=3342799 RepID=UPI0035B9FAA9
MAAARTVHTEVCIVGGGPAGLMLGYLLARIGIDVLVLEKHDDFLRDFRGDTVHPSTLELLGDLGLREEFLKLPHSEVRALDVVVNGIRVHAMDFSHLPAPNDFLAFVPQWDFLDFLAGHALREPSFRLRMGTAATGVRRAGSAVTGVTAVDAEGEFEIVARLTVAADGRASTVRSATGLEPREFGVGVDVLWFELPKPAAPLRPTLAYIDRGVSVLTIDRGSHLQSGSLIAKGGFDEIKRQGLRAFRDSIARAARPLAPVVDSLQDWEQVKLLSVRLSRLETWYRPGLLCIGDAAHAMSPAFGVGVEYAIQDAVATANRLAEPLLLRAIGGPGSALGVTPRDLAAIQRRRLPAVRAMQAVQSRMHRTLARPHDEPLLSNPPTVAQRLALGLIVPAARAVGPRVIGHGLRPERLDDVLLRSL